MNREPRVRDMRQTQGDRLAATERCCRYHEEAAGRAPRRMSRRSRSQAAGS
jgi:hypothetical protein